MVSLVDPNCKDEGARRLDKMEELPKVLSALLQQPAYIAEEEEEGEEYDYDEEGNAVPRHAAAAAAGRTGGLETIYVRVLRPSGPTYTVVELPGLPEEDGAEPGYEEQLRAVLRQHPNFLLLALVPVPDLFDRARSVRMAKEVGGWFGGRSFVGLDCGIGVHVCMYGARLLLIILVSVFYPSVSSPTERANKPTKTKKHTQIRWTRSRSGRSGW